MRHVFYGAQKALLAGAPVIKVTVMQTADFGQLIKDCDVDLRAGRTDNILSYLQLLNLAALPREHALPLANIARRAGLFDFGLKLLNRFVRPENTPMPVEIAEYATLLQKIGANEEAQAMLEQINKAVVPAAKLYQAFQCFHEWDGASAVPFLQTYLDADLAPYERAVGEVNLAAAFLLAGEIDRADDMLKIAIEKNRDDGNARLEGNCFEMRAQVLIGKKLYRDAESTLAQAARLLSGDADPDARFVRKWRCVLEAYETKAVDPLIHFQAEAREQKEWETVRDIDLHLSSIVFSEARFKRLYFGTPYPKYRERILRLTGANAPKPEEVFEYAVEGFQNYETFDLATGRVRGGEARESEIIEPGSKPHQLLTSLLIDLYRPIRTAGIAALLFPEENYDPFNSSDRIHRLIARTRQAIQKAGLPMEIAHGDDGFRLILKGPLKILLSLVRSPTGRNSVYAVKLEEAFGNELFSSAQAMQTLGLSASASAFKRLAASADEVEKIGAGPKMQYRIRANKRTF